MFCSKCGKQIPDDSQFCSSCGYKIVLIKNNNNYNDNAEKKEKHNINSKNSTLIVFTVIILIIIIGIATNIFSGNSRSSTSTTSSRSRSTPPPAPAMNVTLDELINAYRANRVAADEKYKNKNIIITGRIVGFSTAIFSDSPVISFEGDLPISDLLSSGLLGSIYSLVMVFDKQHANIIANLKRGDIVTVEGKFIGLNFANNLEMNNCKIVTPRTSSQSSNQQSTTQTIQPAERRVMYVNANVLNVRNGTSTENDIIDQVNRNTRVQAYYVPNGWSLIYYEDQFGNTESGFVDSRYLSNERTSAPAPTPAPVQTTPVRREITPETMASRDHATHLCRSCGTTRCILFQAEYEDAVRAYDAQFSGGIVPGLLPVGR